MKQVVSEVPSKCVYLYSFIWTLDDGTPQQIRRQTHLDSLLDEVRMISWAMGPLLFYSYTGEVVAPPSADPNNAFLYNNM